jgi:hypothetical protein
VAQVFEQEKNNTLMEYYILESDDQLVLKRRLCLDPHYKDFSIQTYSLNFYSIDPHDLGGALSPHAQSVGI